MYYDFIIIIAYSVFRKGVEVSGLTGLLSSSDHSLTVFVPSDQAFSKLPVWQFEALFDNKDNLKMVCL